jgi:myo-inositol-1(or 4)-monophosphatase
MDQQALGSLCKRAIKIVVDSGSWIRSEFNKVRQADIEVKALNSLVTYVDKEAEKSLTDRLGALLPGSVFLTEEETVETQEGPRRWIIDPLDGTTNFLHGVPFYCISVALEIERDIALGIVYEINHKECFYAWQGGGAFLDGKRIQASSTKNLQDAVIATGFPYHDFSHLEEYLDILKQFMIHSRGVRRLGSAAMDLAYVAAGRFDCFYEYGLNAWDVAAGSLLVEEAGGMVCDFKGAGDFLFGGEILAANKDLWRRALNTIRSILGEY